LKSSNWKENKNNNKRKTSTPRVYYENAASNMVHDTTD